MNVGKTLFAQVMEFVPWKAFGRIVDRHKGDAGMRMLGCADLFRVMAFALSFAAITDEPPEEVAAAGHDPCIVPIRTENIDAWLNPDPKNLAALHAILDDRERPCYEHRMAA